MSNAAAKPDKLVIFATQPKNSFPFAETAKCSPSEVPRWSWSEERKGYVNLGCVKAPVPPPSSWNPIGSCVNGHCPR